MVRFDPKDLPSDDPLRDDLIKLSSLTLESVRHLWDRFDGHNRPMGFGGEAIRAELRRRADDAYCWQTKP